MTLLFLHMQVESIQKMMEIVGGNCPHLLFWTQTYMYVFSTIIVSNHVLNSSTPLNLITILGHISFPSELQSRWLILFLCYNEIFMDTFFKFKVIGHVKANCFFEVTIVVLLSLLSFLMWKWEECLNLQGNYLDACGLEKDLQKPLITWNQNS